MQTEGPARKQPGWHQTFTNHIASTQRCLILWQEKVDPMSYPGDMSHSFGPQIIAPVRASLEQQTGLKQLWSKVNSRVVFIFNPFHMSRNGLEP